MRNRRQITCLVWGITVLGFSMTSARGQDAGRYEATDIEYGARLFSMHCVNCHGENGDLLPQINLRTGINSGPWRVALYVDNLTQEDTPEVVTRLLDFRNFFFIPSQVRTSSLGRGNFIRDFTVTAPRKREFGLEVSYDF